MKKWRHPMQPVVIDSNGTHRFKSNAIVQYLLDMGTIDMNRIALARFSDEDQEQFAQLIGYSVSGAHDLDYMSKRILKKARKASRKLNQEGQETPDEQDPGGAVVTVEAPPGPAVYSGTAEAPLPPTEANSLLYGEVDDG